MGDIMFVGDVGEEGRSDLLGAQYGFLTTLSLVGVDGVTQPLLEENPGYTYEFSGVPVPEMYKK